MNYIDISILAFIQGMTEFLPISSSGHLRLLHHFIGETSDDFMFDIFLHFGTLFSILVFYFRDIKELIYGFFDDIKIFFKREGIKNKTIKDFQYLSYVWYIFISIIPAGVVGFLYEKKVSDLSKNLYVVGGSFLVTAIFLIIAQRMKQTTNRVADLSWKFALVVGLFQMVSILPGISRSGSCLTAALIMGLSRKEALRYIFLIAIPIFFGSALLEVIKYPIGEYLNWTGIYVFVLTFLSGLIFLKLFSQLIKKINLYAFSVYLVFLSYFTFRLAS